MGQYSEEWWFSNGSLAANQRAAVFEEDQNTLASIFSDAGLTIPLANPTVTNGSGVLTFYAADGSYWIFVGKVGSGDSVLATIGVSPDNPVLSVNGELPDGGGNVAISATDVGADPAGAAAAAQAAAIAASDPAGSAAAVQALALLKAQNLADLPNVVTARSSLGLGTAAVTDTGTGNTNTILGNDARLTDARTPTAHASTHAAIGSDPVTLTQAQVTNLTTDLAAKQPLDSDLTTIAALTPSNDDILQRKAGAWANRTIAQLKTDLAYTAAQVGAVATTATPDQVYGTDDAGAAITYNVESLTQRTLTVFSDDRNVLTTGNGDARFYNREGSDLVIVGAWVSAGIVPTGAAILIDVNSNGSTIYSTQANRPTVAAASNGGGISATPNTTAFAQGDYLTVDIDQIGATIAGGRITVGIVVHQNI